MNGSTCFIGSLGMSPHADDVSAIGEAPAVYRPAQNAKIGFDVGILPLDYR